MTGLPQSTREWTLKAYPEGTIVPERDFELKTVPLRELKENEVLTKNVVIALDIGNPNVRGYGPPLPLGSVMRGFAVGQVIASKNPAFKPGDRLDGLLGWTEHSILVPQESQRLPKGVLSEMAIHMLGNSGLTAFFGIREVLKPKPGETAVVSAAAGAVGMVACQLLKKMGCRVIGVAGSDAKCKWLVETLGIDAAINRREPSDVVLKKLAELTPNFIDVFFDNTGGFMLSAVLDRIALNGRIGLCGAVELYNSPDPRYPLNTLTMVTQRALMKGFLCPDYASDFPEAKKQLAGWIADGSLKSEQWVVRDFERLPHHFCSMFEGVNTGKLVVRIAEEDPET